MGGILAEAATATALEVLAGAYQVDSLSGSGVEPLRQYLSQGITAFCGNSGLGHLPRLHRRQDGTALLHLVAAPGEAAIRRVGGEVGEAIGQWASPRT